MLADAIQGLRGCVLALGLSVFVFLSLRYRPRFIWGVRNGGVRGLLIITPTPLAPGRTPRAGLGPASRPHHPGLTPRPHPGTSPAAVRPHPRGSEGAPGDELPLRPPVRIKP